MLPKTISVKEEEITLVMRSGIQFLDFDMKIDPKKLGEGGFVLTNQENCLLERLDYDREADEYYLPRLPGEQASNRRKAIRPNLALTINETISLLEDIWLPLPIFRIHGASNFNNGPSNWARARIVALPPSSEPDAPTHRLVLSFDTNVDDEEIPGSRYLIPTLNDVTGGHRFALAWRASTLSDFCVRGGWVWNWLAEVYSESCIKQRCAPEDIADNLGNHHHLGHYLNYLWLVGAALRGPERMESETRPWFALLLDRAKDGKKAIEVDLVLDIGNSRTVGILVEEHPQENDGLHDRYVLQLRDLTRPHLVYEDPFESRVEFSEAAFGKVDHSCQSGRNTFLWPTMARVGPEAARLAARRRGTEGSTGLSSPKRYLWDEDSYISGWRFNAAFNKADAEPLATAMPFSDLINEAGEALFDRPDDLPVFDPHYSRSSLMTFMLAEVLVQVLTQINSPGQRLRTKLANNPRHLRSVVLTVPPSMPKPEREIFQDRVRQAIGLVWMAMGWLPADAKIDIPNNSVKLVSDHDPDIWPPLPRMRLQWDEATAAQLVWIYSEIVNYFGGRPGDFVSLMRKKRRNQDNDRKLRVASIDIGGGTTDLVICDYQLDSGRGANVTIEPKQVFRDGFRVAGDDIVLDVISFVVVDAIRRELRAQGAVDPEPAITRMMGAEASDIQDAVARQKLTLQIFYPLALAILQRYENYDPLVGAETESLTFADMLKNVDAPSAEVLDYVERCVREKSAIRGFDLMAVPIAVDCNKLHEHFLSDQMAITKTIRSLCEIVYLYDVDWLLLSGRPSRLPGVQSLLRIFLPLPPDRVLPLHNYRTGDWYPFNRQHCIQDPKTTAAVGAMLCMLCADKRLPNFFFASDRFKITSTVRHIGLLDNTLTIKDSDVYYQDIDLDDPEYELDSSVAFEMRGPISLGFRQLDSARWGGSPLYRLDFSDQENNRAQRILKSDGSSVSGPNILHVSLKRKIGNGRDQMKIGEVTTANGDVISSSALRIRLMTLNAVGLAENSYWLDTGNIAR